MFNSNFFITVFKTSLNSLLLNLVKLLSNVIYIYLMSSKKTKQIIQDPEVIDNFDVQEVAPIDEAQVNFPEEGEMVETSASSIDLNGIVAYYKRWLQMNPSYANQLISRLKAHMFV